MNRRETGSDLDSSNHFVRGNRSHGHHEGTFEHPRLFARNIGDIHGHILALFNVSKGNPGLHEGEFEGVATPQEEGDQVRSPIWGNILDFLDKGPFLIHSILGQVRPEISSRGHFLGFKYPLFQDLQEGTRFWVSLAEKEEVEGIPFGEDHEIGLGIA